MLQGFMWSMEKTDNDDPTKKGAMCDFRMANLPTISSDSILSGMLTLNYKLLGEQFSKAKGWVFKSPQCDGVPTLVQKLFPTQGAGNTVANLIKAQVDKIAAKAKKKFL